MAAGVDPIVGVGDGVYGCNSICNFAVAITFVVTVVVDDDAIELDDSQRELLSPSFDINGDGLLVVAVAADDEDDDLISEVGVMDVFGLLFVMVVSTTNSG